MNDEIDYEMLLWNTFKENGFVDMVIKDYGFGDKHVKFDKLYYHFNDNDYPNDGNLEEYWLDDNLYSMGFCSGFYDIEEYNIPEEVFNEMFKNKLQEYISIDWNDAEQSHTFVSKHNMTVLEAKNIIIPILEENGFVEYE